LEISSGTFIDNIRVEFTPGTVGSGAKDMEVSCNKEAPLEQSETDARAVGKRYARRRANIIFEYGEKSLGRDLQYRI
jgi:hypothetical protein